MPESDGTFLITPCLVGYQRNNGSNKWRNTNVESILSSYLTLFSLQTFSCISSLFSLTCQRDRLSSFSFSLFTHHFTTSTPPPLHTPLGSFMVTIETVRFHSFRSKRIAETDYLGSLSFFLFLSAVNLLSRWPSSLPPLAISLFTLYLCSCFSVFLPFAALIVMSLAHSWCFSASFMLSSLSFLSFLWARFPPSIPRRCLW